MLQPYKKSDEIALNKINDQECQEYEQKLINKCKLIREDNKGNTLYEIMIVEVRDIQTKNILFKQELCKLIAEFSEGVNTFLQLIDINWIFKVNNAGLLLKGLKVIEQCILTIISEDDQPKYRVAVLGLLSITSDFPDHMFDVCLIVQKFTFQQLATLFNISQTDIINLVKFKQLFTNYNVIQENQGKLALTLKFVENCLSSIDQDLLLY